MPNVEDWTFKNSTDMNLMQCTDNRKKTNNVSDYFPWHISNNNGAFVLHKRSNAINILPGFKETKAKLTNKAKNINLATKSRTTITRCVECQNWNIGFLVLDFVEAMS